MSSILFIQNISLIKSYFVHVNQRDTHFSAIFFTQLLLCEIHNRGIKEPFHGFSFFIPSHLFMNQRIESKFVLNQEREIRFCFFSNFKEMKFERVKIRLDFPYKFVNAGLSHKTISTQRGRERESTINQSK